MKYGHRASTRSPEGSMMSMSFDRSRPGFCSTLSTATRSPGSTNGASTIWPLTRARPSPPYISFSMVMSSLFAECGIAYDKRLSLSLNHESTRLLRRSTVRQSAHRELSGCARQLGQDAVRLREHFLHCGSARHHRISASGRAAGQDRGDCGSVPGGGNRPEALEHYGAIGSARACRAGLDADVCDACRLAGAHDPVQGQSGGATDDWRRPAAIPGADGGRYSAVPGGHRAGG